MSLDYEHMFVKILWGFVEAWYRDVFSKKEFAYFLSVPVSYKPRSSLHQNSSTENNVNSSSKPFKDQAYEQKNILENYCFFSLCPKPVLVRKVSYFITSLF